ncbi:glycosyltransferase, partial [Myxococcota bacterium]|nr:glycosyltransferase [Myxococcota bacterium]
MAAGPRILFVHQDDRLPSSRIRIVELLPHLAAEGLEVASARYPRTRAEKRALFSSLSAFDAVVLQKKLPSFVDAWRWSRAPIPIVFDFDDAIMLRDRPKHGRWTSATRRRRFDRIARMSSGLVAGNAYLASFVPADKPVLVLPSPVPHDVPQRTHGDAGPLRVGWLGTGKNLVTLDAIRRALGEVHRRRPFVLSIVSDWAPQYPELDVEWLPWSISAERDGVARFDVGVMSLSGESPWDKGKCSYKLLKYMAAGVPVVASKVGMNEEVVSPASGVLVTSEAEWI